MKVGIIGFGSFGSFAAQVLSPHADIYVYSDHPLDSSAVHVIDFDDLKDMDVIILAVPLSSYEVILERLQPILHADMVVVDICSVKVRSREYMLRILDGHENILITHPLFGPQSAADTTAGHDIIVTDIIGERAEELVAFCEHVLGLRVHHFSADEHDHVMAYVHVLTFFVGRGLTDSNLPALPFKTPSYDTLTALVTLDQRHSPELFMTIQQGNPYAEQVRREFIETLEKLDLSIKNTAS